MRLWHPCDAADPHSGSAIASSGMHACFKVRGDYQQSPTCHWRPVTGHRGSEGPSARWEAMDRVYGASANLARLQVYMEQSTQSVSGESLKPAQVTVATNKGSERCEIRTLHAHLFHEGYTVSLNIKGVDPRQPVHASPKAVLAVPSDHTFVVSGQVPKKIDGVPLETVIFGRSKVERANGTFVSTISWVSLSSALRARFAEAIDSLKGKDAAGAIKASIEAAERGVEAAMAKCTPVYGHDDALLRSRVDALLAEVA